MKKINLENIFEEFYESVLENYDIEDTFYWHKGERYYNSNFKNEEEHIKAHTPPTLQYYLNLYNLDWVHHNFCIYTKEMYERQIEDYGESYADEDSIGDVVYVDNDIFVSETCLDNWNLSRSLDNKKMESLEDFNRVLEETLASQIINLIQEKLDATKAKERLSIEKLSETNFLTFFEEKLPKNNE